MSDTFHRTRIELFAISVAFFISLVFYFTPLQIPYKLAIPVALLFTASLKLLPWQMSLAMLFSCVGDFFGASGRFLEQMASFSLAHIFIIFYFVSRYRLGVLRRKYSRLSMRYMILAILIVLPILVFAFIKIVPSVPVGLIRYGVSFYAALISIMLWCALQQRSLLFSLGAMFFVVSDTLLAWNRFVEPLQYSNCLVLVPYYLAQWLLFLRSTKWWGRYMIKE